MTMLSLFLSLSLFSIPGKATVTKFRDGARYLIIAPDEFYDELLPLAEWKTRKGMLAKIAKLSEVGSSASEIRNYILNAYNNWNPRPEYVLLVGNADYIPFPYVSGIRSDCYYGNMDGDIYDEVIPGRFPAFDEDEVANFVHKVLHYEMEPYMDDLSWFLKATHMIEIDYDESDSIYWSDVLHAETLMVQAGYSHIDIFSDTAGYDASDVYAAIEDGRSFLNFRGQSVCHWWYPFTIDPYNTNPGYKLPVVISTTCGQVQSDFQCGSEWVRAGSVEDPRGGIAFCGPTTVITGGAHKRSALNKGFFDYVFITCAESVATFGKAVEAGRIRYYELYSDNTEFYGFTAIGDPELNIWTGTPKSIEVDHPPLAFVGPNSFAVTVTRDGNPVEYANVCVMTSSGSVYEYGQTDSNGQVTFSISPTYDDDTLYVTVTGKNLRPYLGWTPIIPQGPVAVYQKHIVDDSAGNNDQKLNPNETVNLTIWLVNSGTEDANSVTATLSTDDEYVEVINSTSFFGDIPAGDSAASETEYVIHISPDCPDSHVIIFQLTAHDADSHEWESQFTDVVHAPKLKVVTYTIDDTEGGNGNGALEPGEYASLKLTIENTGSQDAVGVTVVLSESDEYLMISSPEGLLSLVPTGSQAISTPFILSLSEDSPQPRTIQIFLNMTTDMGVTLFDTFSLCVGTLGFSDDVENGANGWTHYPVSNDYNDQWHITTVRSHSSSHAWFCGEDNSSYSNYLDAALVTPEINLPPNSELHFWHWMDAETSNQYPGEAYDGGIVEISVNGSEWQQIFPDGGYNYVIRGGSGNPLPAGTQVFSGYIDWTEVVFDLSEFSGPVRFRFRFTSDQGVAAEGWYIDDISIVQHPTPDIDVAPSYLADTVTSGTSVVETLVIKNTGASSLDFEIEVFDEDMKPMMDDWLSVSITSGTIAAGDSLSVFVTMSAVSMPEGNYIGYLKISSNDQDEADLVVPVTMTVQGCIPGDANGDGEIDIADLETIGAYLFNNGPEPLICADANGDCDITAADLAYLANYLYYDGNSPLPPCSSEHMKPFVEGTVMPLAPLRATTPKSERKER